MDVQDMANSLLFANISSSSNDYYLMGKYGRRLRVACAEEMQFFFGSTFRLYFSLKFNYFAHVTQVS